MKFDDLARMMKTMSKEEVQAEVRKLSLAQRMALADEVCRRVEQFTSMAMVTLGDIAVEHNLAASQPSKQETMELMQRLTGKKQEF